MHKALLTEPVVFRASPALARAVRERAEDRGMKMGEYIRQVLRDQAEDQGQTCVR